MQQQPPESTFNFECHLRHRQLVRALNRGRPSHWRPHRAVQLATSRGPIPSFNTSVSLDAPSRHSREVTAVGVSEVPLGSATRLVLTLDVALRRPRHRDEGFAKRRASDHRISGGIEQVAMLWRVWAGTARPTLSSSCRRRGSL